MYWIGSIWNDAENHGNIDNIKSLKQSLDRHNISFVHCVGISDEDNILNVRRSRIAPAVGGAIQVTKNMLTCRLWKNISYGQLGITNLPKSLDVFGTDLVFDCDIDKLVDQEGNR